MALRAMVRHAHRRPAPIGQFLRAATGAAQLLPSARGYNGRNQAIRRKAVALKRKIVLALAVLAGTATTAAAASSPSVKTGPATNIKETSAVLNGTINPDGQSTKYWVEWGLTTAYGSKSSVHTLKSGTKAVSVHLTASGLSPDVQYHYRLFAQNASGTSSGADRTFKTTGHALPVAETEPASMITTSGAVISGVVDPNGQSTRTEFEWGSSPTTLNNTVPGQTVPASTPLQTVATQLTGLAAGTTFYYRVLVYRGVVGWIPASTLSFTTLPLSRPYAGMHASTSPHRDRHKPFAFTTSGSISGPFPAAAQCTGTVTLRYYAGGRQIKVRQVPVQSNCTFSHEVLVNHTHAPHRGARRPSVQTLRIVIRFGGNGYLAQRQRVESVVMG